MRSLLHLTPCPSLLIVTYECIDVVLCKEQSYQDSIYFELEHLQAIFEFQSDAAQQI